MKIMNVVMDSGGRNVGTSLFENLVDDLFGGFVDVLFLVAFLSELELSAIFMK